MLTWRIALRYLLSKKSHSAVNVISTFSVAGVAVATAAIVIVLSVFNGFTNLCESRLSYIDPQIKIEPVRGKAISNGDSIASLLKQLPWIAGAAPVIEERGLAVKGNSQKPIIFKGVNSDYGQIIELDSIVIDGEYCQEAYDSHAIMLSAGTAIDLNARPNGTSIVQLFVPRRLGRINPANPSKAFRKQDFITTAVFQVDQPEYDANYAYIPLDVARDLLQYESEATAIEVKVAEGLNPNAYVRELKSILGDNYAVLTRAEQEAQSFKMIMVEKWITFLMLAFILVIASFNIISTLSLLVIEKRSNMITLIDLGAPKTLIRNIFINLGILISMIGGLVGIALGSFLSLLQQYCGLIKLSGDPSQLSINVYPVRVELIDLVAVFGLVCIVAIGASSFAILFTRRIKSNASPIPVPSL